MVTDVNQLMGQVVIDPNSQEAKQKNVALLMQELLESFVKEFGLKLEPEPKTEECVL
jgi:hypothetical protein